MPVIRLETYVNAPVRTVFNLSRNVDLHKASMTKYQEAIIAGTASGLMQKGDTVTWQAKHFFKSRRLQVKITGLNEPVFFSDEMEAGDFKQMKHDHYFKTSGAGTIMIDRFDFTSPFGLLGQLADRLFLKNYMQRLLIERNIAIKTTAESDQWKQYINL